MRQRSSGGAQSKVVPEATGPLLYKVVELSTVDEGSLEQALNAWVSQGWTLDGVHFAMRESSKRPAMAFVFFTRRGQPGQEQPYEAEREKRSNPDAGRSGSQAAAYATSARERLARLAGLDEGDAP